MKVETNVKAGGLLQDAAYQASAIAGQVTGFVAEANQQAENLTSGVVDTTTSLWNYVTNSLGL